MEAPTLEDLRFDHYLPVTNMNDGQAWMEGRLEYDAWRRRETQMNASALGNYVNMQSLLHWTPPSYISKDEKKVTLKTFADLLQSMNLKQAIGRHCKVPNNNKNPLNPFWEESKEESDVDEENENVNDQI